MATVGPTIIYDLTMGGTMRMGGSLAAATTLTNGNTYRERIVIPHRAGTINARAKVDVSGGTPTVQIVPQLPTIVPPSLTVGSVASGLTTATNLSDDTEAVHSYTSKGEQIVDVVVDVTGASAAGTLTYVDVSVVRL